MTIAFLITRFEKPSARYRVLQYLPFLEQAGHRFEVYVIPKNPLSRIKLFRRLRAFDLVFLQKKLLNRLDWYILRRSSRRLVYDFDDAVMFRDSNRQNQLSGKRSNKFKRIMKNSDMVIAGNEYLRSLAIKENLNTFVVPTPIDMDRYRERQTANPADSIVLGWIGSNTTISYLEKMGKVLDSIFERFPNAQLKIVADKFFDCKSMPVIKKLWRYDEEISDLHTFDIGLMPLTDDVWSRGKCGFKLLQYMAVGIPAVCSPVGVNREIVTDGENGFWASSEHEWIDKISMLITNQPLRIVMGRRARETVLKSYSTEANSRKLIELFESLNK